MTASPPSPENNAAEPTFPHPSYAKHVLRPAFDDARRLLFAPMLMANSAHLVMLSETGIIPAEAAGRVLAALRQIAAAGAEAFSYAPAVEDLFFAVEGQLIALAGADAGGNLQIARSRNDLDAVMCRLMLRQRLLATVDQTLRLRQHLIDLAVANLETLMAGTTHTQPAQPTTLAHYFGGVLGPLARDTQRLADAYRRVNQNPLGVAAFTTTGFPIDRDLTADLLGFHGLVENGYDAVGASDHMLEATGALVITASSLSRFVHDLLIWARPENGTIRIADAFIQISSIMPQKRNPVVLEHIRARIGYVYGDAATVATMVHSSAFGDTVDIEDDIYLPLARCFDAMHGVLDLMIAVIATLDVNRPLLAERAGRGFTTSTELADTLVRRCGCSFRAAHAIVSAVVSGVAASGGDAPAIDAALVNRAAERVLGHALALDDEMVRTALDPMAFVRARTVAGGSAPDAMRQALDRHAALLDEDQAWLDAARRRLTTADAERERRAAALAALAD